MEDKGPSLLLLMGKDILKGSNTFNLIPHFVFYSYLKPLQCGAIIFLGYLREMYRNVEKLSQCQFL